MEFMEPLDTHKCIPSSVLSTVPILIGNLQVSVLFGPAGFPKLGNTNRLSLKLLAGNSPGAQGCPAGVSVICSKHLQLQLD